MAGLTCSLSYSYILLNGKSVQFKFVKKLKRLHFKLTVMNGRNQIKIKLTQTNKLILTLYYELKIKLKQLIVPNKK